MQGIISQSVVLIRLPYASYLSHGLSSSKTIELSQQARDVLITRPCMSDCKPPYLLKDQTYPNHDPLKEHTSNILFTFELVFL